MHYDYHDTSGLTIKYFTLTFFKELKQFRQMSNRTHENGR